MNKTVIYKRTNGKELFGPLALRQVIITNLPRTSYEHLIFPQLNFGPQLNNNSLMHLFDPKEFTLQFFGNGSTGKLWVGESFIESEYYWVDSPIFHLEEHEM